MNSELSWSGQIRSLRRTDLQFEDLVIGTKGFFKGFVAGDPNKVTDEAPLHVAALTPSHVATRKSSTEMAALTSKLDLRQHR
ncbi:conserved hypothetical protein [Ricinus communis]|uniref:Uncharacterized protein n=1 Tax=Ricinus communis TaxID=3988 RepID=B9T4M5_RICCO|nr:conserved hypothetical protein [Ricinus communis]